MVPLSTGTFTSPASSPLVSVVIVAAVTGCTARANPPASVVTTNARRVTSVSAPSFRISSFIRVAPKQNLRSNLTRDLLMESLGAEGDAMSQLQLTCTQRRRLRRQLAEATDARL